MKPRKTSKTVIGARVMRSVTLENGEVVLGLNMDDLNSSRSWTKHASPCQVCRFGPNSAFWGDRFRCPVEGLVASSRFHCNKVIWLTEAEAVAHRLEGVL